MDDYNFINTRHQDSDEQIGRMIKEDNCWITWSKIIPWERLSEIYKRSMFLGTTFSEEDIRLMIGILIIKRQKNIPFETIVEEIGKNSSIQYFLGFEEFETDREIDNKSLLVQSLYKIESSLKEYSDNKKMVRRNIMNRKSDLFKNNKQLIFRNSGGYLFINPEDVIYLNANGNYTSFILENEQPRRVNSIMGQIELRLNPNKFIRINRSYIINLDYISEINLSKRQCKLHSKNGKEFYCPISRGKITKISRKIKELKTFIS